jgi:hypothetical protein
VNGKDEIIGRKLEKTALHNELHNEPDDLNFSTNIFQEIKSDGVGWSEFVARMWERYI